MEASKLIIAVFGEVSSEQREVEWGAPFRIPNILAMGECLVC